MVANNNRRKRLNSRFNCNNCIEMNELKDQWKDFIRYYRSSRRWFITTIIIVVGMFMTFTITAFTKSMNAVTKDEFNAHVAIAKEQIEERVTPEEMGLWLIMEMEYVKRIILMDKAEVSDSIIDEVFENHKWLIHQFMEYNPRSLSPKPDYSAIFKNYKKRNEPN